MKVTYIASDPLRYPRIRKIAYTLKKSADVQFHVMIPKIRFVWHGSRIKRVMSAIINYVTIILQIFFVKSDIFWVANSPDILVLPLVLRRKRYILEYRSPWHIEVEREFGRGPWVRLAAIIENFALKNASLITLTTSKIKVKIKNFGKPFFVIPNYPLTTFEASIPRKEFRRQQNVKDSGKVVLFVGRLSSHEGADLLPNTVKNVLKKEKNVVFWIVGDGPLYPMLRKLSEKMVNRLRLFGWQAYESIPNFINAADVCVLPMRESKYAEYYNEEGLQKISEYMFFEKPIVACGVARSEEYLLVDEGGMADGIVKALNGQVPPSRRRTWEDYCEKKIYEIFSPRWLRVIYGVRSQKEATAWKRKQRAKEALTCLKLAGHNAKSGLLIDVGCGLGYLTAHALDVGIKAIGVDVSKENVKVAKKEIAPNGSFILANGVKLPFRDECFTTIILNDVLEHVPYDLAHPMLNEIKRILKVDGKLYISVANRYQIREPHTQIPFLTWLPKPCWDTICRLIRKRPYQNYYPYTIGRLEKICRGVGLTCSDYTWFYAWEKCQNIKHIGDPALRGLVKTLRKLELFQMAYTIAKKVSVILFICEK
jgi:glycosyltransferase involved in cell wall biosynthesis/ubiquinone/menaquinone biosynthesis C-methylase UbiE